MKTVRVLILLVTAITWALFFAGPGSAQEVQPKRSPTTGQAGQENPALRLLSQLNLSNDQKHRIALILRDNRDTLREEITAVVQARFNLFRSVHGDTLDEDAVHQASQDLAEAEENLAVSSAGIFNQVKSVLTPDQMAVLQGFREDMARRMQQRIGSFATFIDSWIDKYGQ